MKVIFATTFNTVGEPHSDLPIVGLIGTARKRGDKILRKLAGKRTRFERSRQEKPSLFWSVEMKGKELRVWMPKKVLR